MANRTTSCDQLERAMARAGLDAVREARLEAHVAECARCRALAVCLAATHELLASPPADFAPPPGFAARVVAQLPAPESQLLGWAALRLLPASLVVALACGVLLATEPASASFAGAAADGELLLWLFAAAGGAP